MAEAVARGDLQRLELRDGAALHFVEQGRGAPLLLVHGGGRDLRSWLGQIPWLAERWLVLAPSRRYCWPNGDPPLSSDYSPIVDADDLAELLERRSAAGAVVVGSSMGAAAALHLAVRRPALVRALSLAEPPVHRWAERTEEGAAELATFMERAWRPAARSFAQSDRVAAMRLLIDHFLGAGAFDRLLPGVRARLLENARDFEAQTRSTDAFPDPGRDRVARLTLPVQMLSGSRTLRLHAIVDDELASTLRSVRRSLIRDAGHDVWADVPRSCAAELRGFLDDVSAA